MSCMKKLNASFKNNAVNRMATLVGVMLLNVTVSQQVMAVDEYTIELYEVYCKACHASAGAGVPVAFNDADWHKRLNSGREAVIKNAIVGIGNMPPQGQCMECSYDDFENLIDYMSAEKTE